MRLLFFCAGILISSASSAQNQSSTSTSTIEKQPPQWRFSIESANSLSAVNRQKFGESAPVISSNTLGLAKELSSDWKLQLRQSFEVTTHSQNLEDEVEPTTGNRFERGAFALLLAQSIKAGVLKSKPARLKFLYEAPADWKFQKGGDQGMFYVEASAEWEMAPRWSWTAWAAPDVKLGQMYELTLLPSLNYTWNDQLSAYYGYGVLLGSTLALHGDWRPDSTNLSTHELGLIWSRGVLRINPTLASKTSLDNGEGSFFTKQSRAFASETITYHLNLSANF